MKKQLIFLLILTATGLAFGQSAEAYRSSKGKETGLLDPSRFDINHSLSFGMHSSSKSDIKSQSLYSTMIQYQFSQPVTLNLNFSLPIHSTFNQSQNLTSQNVQSLDYFKTMPFDVSLSWQPRENMLMRFTVSRQVYDGYNSLYGNYWGSPYRSLLRDYD